MHTPHHPSAPGAAWRLLLIAIWLLSSASSGARPAAADFNSGFDRLSQPPGPAQDAPAPPAPDPLGLPPAPEDAAVVDPHNPNWVTHYGTQRGRLLFPPRRPVFEAPSPLGPISPVGRWQDFFLQDPVSTVTAIAAMNDGALAVGVQGGGVWLWIKDTYGVYVWYEIRYGSTGLASDNVLSLAAVGNELWVGTSDAGISIMNLSSFTWRQYNTSSGMPGNSIRRMWVGSGEFPDIWAATDNGAALISTGFSNPPEYSITVWNTTSGLRENSVKDVVALSNGDVWFATDTHLDRVVRSAGNAWDYFNAANTGACALDRATRIAVTPDGSVWFAASAFTPALAQAGAVESQAASPQAPEAWANKGLCRYKNSTWELHTAASDGLPGNGASDLAVDAAGRLWASFNGIGASGGVSVWDPTGCGGAGSTLSYRATDLFPVIRSSAASAIAATGDGVWIGYSSVPLWLTRNTPNWNDYTPSVMGSASAHPGPLLISDSKVVVGLGAGYSTWNGTSWSYAPVSTNHQNVLSMAFDPRDNLVVGTAGGGVWFSSWTGSLHWQSETTFNGLPNDTVTSLLYDHQDRLWAGTVGGLALKDHGYWTSFTTTNSGLPDDYVTALAVDEQDRVWAGTNGGGLALFDTTLGGAGAWTTYTMTSGLASNTILSLAMDPHGVLLAGTTGGVSQRDPASGTWTRLPTAGLPDLNVHDLAVTSDGRLWAATAKGLALWFNGSWRSWRVPQSAIEANYMLHVATDDNLTWTSSYYGGVAVRAALIPPIGYCQPAISGFSPHNPTPGQLVTLTGSNFDTRDPSFNIITVVPEYAPDPDTIVKAVAVSATSLQFILPATTVSGYLKVTANDRTSATFMTDKLVVVPVITGLNTTGCAAVGDTLEIYGAGFNSGGSEGVQVAFGSSAFSASQLVDSWDATLIRLVLLPGLAPGGTVKVRAGQTADKPVATFPTNVQIAYPVPRLDRTRLQQSVEGEQMIWGKRTLVRLALESSIPGCPAHVDDGSLNWLTKNLQDSDFQGSNGIHLTSPNGLVVPSVSSTRPNLDETANLIATFDTNCTCTHWFPLALFAGMRIRLYNNGFPALLVNGKNYVDIPPAQAPFGDFGVTPTDVMIIAVGNNSIQWPAFWQSYETGVADMARIFPQQDYFPNGGGDQWVFRAETILGWDEASVDLDTGYFGDFGDLQDDVDDYLSDWNDGVDEYGGHHIERAIGLIADGLYAGGPSGKSIYSCPIDPVYDCDAQSVLAFNFPPNPPNQRGGGSIMVHELVHTTNWVDEDSANFDTGNEQHSMYDEGQWANNVCDPNLTFVQALQLGQGPNIGRVVYLPDRYLGGALREFPMLTCGDLDTMPRSLMSYAPFKGSNNTYLEPLDYSHLVAHMPTRLLNQAGLQALQTGQETGVPKPEDLTRLDAPQRFLRLAGRISASDAVTVTLSHFFQSLQPGSPPANGSPYRLVLLSAQGNVLSLLPFTPRLRTGDGELLPAGRFSLKAPAPTGVAQAQLLHGDQVLWQGSVSGHAPTVALTAPDGGVYDGAAEIPVTWTASDADGDPLAFALDYSADDGATWTLVDPHLSGSSYTWKPVYATPSTAGRLRLRASDGFNTAQSISNPFTLTARPPLAIISSPLDGQTVTEGENVSLSGSSLTSHGSRQGDFTWKIDSSTVGTSQAISHTFNTIGDHTVLLQVSSDGLTGEASAVVHVVKDYDHDGMPNDWEQGYGFNPLSAQDAVQDPDGDGLTNLQEYRLGTNPLVKDTDSDGYTDGSEVSNYTDPGLFASKPSSTKSLVVGSKRIIFNYDQGGPLPAASSFWVNGIGGAGIRKWTWTASSSQPFIHVSGGGTGAGQLSISVDPAGLAPGKYSGSVTITALGLEGSPAAVQVKLFVHSPQGNPLYLPLLLKH
jgi:ligand-binding sensor domain-containing protein